MSVNGYSVLNRVFLRENVSVRNLFGWLVSVFVNCCCLVWVRIWFVSFIVWLFGMVCFRFSFMLVKWGVVLMIVVVLLWLWVIEFMLLFGYWGVWFLFVSGIVFILMVLCSVLWVYRCLVRYLVLCLVMVCCRFLGILMLVFLKFWFFSCVLLKFSDISGRFGNGWGQGRWLLEVV